MAYLGMDARTGLRLTGHEHLAQSMRKILGTQIGTRLRRRPFGSMAPDIVDAPTNRSTLLQLYAAAATALMSWEPRVRINQITALVSTANLGSIDITVHGEAELEDGSTAPINVTTTLGA